MKNIFLILFLFINAEFLYSQLDANRVKEVDSVYIFKPIEELKPFSEESTTTNNAIGFDLSFSNSGIGFGLFYNYNINKNNMLSAMVSFSGARNTDEFEYYDWNTGRWVVPGKINRLYLVPITINYTRFIFADKIGGNFKPYIGGGIGPSMIFQTPYEKDWFDSWNYSTTYVRYGGYVAIGGYFKSLGNSIAALNIKYYYIPFGDKGLESIEGSPITNFGGLVLSLSVGYDF